jgi:hypothetical protein
MIMSNLKQRFLLKVNCTNLLIFALVFSFVGMAELHSENLVTPTKILGHTNTTINAFAQIEAESFSEEFGGVQAEAGGNIGYIKDGRYVVYNNVDFGTGATTFKVKVAAEHAGGSIELRLGSATGTLVGTCAITVTGGFGTYVEQSCPVSGASGVHNLYLVFKGDAEWLFNIDWFVFYGTGGIPVVTIDAFRQIEAEAFSLQFGGVQAEAGGNIGFIQNGRYVVYNNVDFATGASSFKVNVGAGEDGGTIELRLGSATGTLIGTCTVAATGGHNVYTEQSCAIQGAIGVHNLYLVFKGTAEWLFNIDWFVFVRAATSVTNFSMINDVKIYPNPTSDIISLTFKESEMNRELKIFNSVGQLVLQAKAEDANVQLNLKSLNVKGFVTIQVVSGNETSNYKVVVK